MQGGNGRNAEIRRISVPNATQLAVTQGGTDPAVAMLMAIFSRPRFNHGVFALFDAGGLSEKHVTLLDTSHASRLAKTIRTR